MKNIILVMFICLMPSVVQTSHVLPYKIEWKIDKTLDTVNGGIKLKSSLPLKNWKIEKIRQIYFSAEYLFFHEFENIECLDLGPLEIRIVSANILRDKKYFEYAEPRNFGRYFESSNTIYIINEVFEHPEYLAHELAHYFYDECGIKFINDDAEHVKVYRFQDLYEEKNIHRRD